MKNHTATHLLSFALRKELGEVDQCSSSIVPNKLTLGVSAKVAKVLIYHFMY